MVPIKIRTKRLDGMTEVRLLITHPMHTGRQKDPSSNALIAAHYLRELRIERNGQLLVDCTLSTAVSRDPYLSFRFEGGASGDRLTVHWSDNLGGAGTEQMLLP
ncbi:thiosulfate oxidation carrier complex protein SoxZ [Methylolobus aquaticus]